MFDLNFLSLRKCLFSLIFFLGLSFPLCALDNPLQKYQPNMSGATVNTQLDYIYNPVFPAINDNLSLYFREDNINTSRKDLSENLIIRALGFQFYGKWTKRLYNSDLAVRENEKAFLMQLSQGFWIRNKFGFGFSYKHLFTESQTAYAKNLWDFSFLTRPVRWLSLGVILKDVGQPVGAKYPFQTVFSLGFRPYKEYLTLSVDAILAEKMQYLFTVAVRLPWALSLYGSYNLNKTFSFGLNFAYNSFDNFSSYQTDYSLRHDSTGLQNSVGVGWQLAKKKEALGSKKVFVSFKIEGSYNEVEEANFFQQPKITFYELVKGLNYAANDRMIKGVFLEIDGLDLSLAQIEELRKEIKNCQKNKKPVYAILKHCDNKEYLLASAANQIYLSPNCNFILPGLAVKVYFFKDGLKKLGIKYEYVRHGKYKSFAEPFTRTAMSPAYRQNMEKLIKNLNQQFVQNIAQDRQLKEKDVYQILNKGYLEAEEAQSLGLVDQIMYPADVKIKYTGVSPLLTDLFVVAGENYLNTFCLREEWGALPTIALIYVNGSIVHQNNFSQRLPNRISDAEYAQNLEKAFRSPQTKAVVIRVDSGGGDALAADNMWYKLIQMKKMYPKKPVIFSFGSTAASGGYYLACTGDKILVDQASVTGSIGVIWGKISAKELYKKIGISKEIIKEAEFADLFDESKELTAKEEALIQKSVDSTYSRFTSKVKKARDFDDLLIKERAEGRVFTGEQAVENNLADQIGGILTALDLAATMAKLKDYEIKVYPQKSQFNKRALNSALQYSFLPSNAKKIVTDLETLAIFENKCLYMLPYKIEIQ